MKKHNIFFDYRFKNAGYIEVWPSSLGIQNYDVVDLSINGNIFNTIRLNFAVSSFGGLLLNSVVAVRLHHGDTNPPTIPISANDIIGPVDNDGQSIAGPNGEWKILQTWNGINIQNMGYRIYSVNYVGQKRYIQLSHNIIEGPPAGIVRSICFAMIANINMGKCYDYYGYYGIDGGQ